MFKNKANGRNNISGLVIRNFRLQMDPPVSQRQFAEMLQINGLDIDKNAIQRIESGKRYVTDIELKAIAKLLRVNPSVLLGD